MLTRWQHLFGCQDTSCKIIPVLYWFTWSTMSNTLLRKKSKYCTKQYRRTASLVSSEAQSKRTCGDREVCRQLQLINDYTSDSTHSQAHIHSAKDVDRNLPHIYIPLYYKNSSVCGARYNDWYLLSDSHHATLSRARSYGAKKSAIYIWDFTNERARYELHTQIPNYLWSLSFWLL